VDAEIDYTNKRKFLFKCKCTAARRSPDLFVNKCVTSATKAQSETEEISEKWLPTNDN